MVGNEAEIEQLVLAMTQQFSLKTLKGSLSKWNRRRKVNSLIGRWFRKRKLNRILGRVTVATQKAFDAQSEVSLDDVKAVLRGLTPHESTVPLIRIGPDFDGGYLLPDDLKDISALFSPGVSETLGFDLEFAKRGINCFLADASIDVPKNLLPNMQFQQKYIGPKNTSEFMTLESWVDESVSPGDDLVLQMDIEGAEYSVLQNLADDTLAKFRILLIEFHQLHHVFLPEKHALYKDVFAKLLRTHKICHIHANNAESYVCVSGLTIPPIIELTLLRNDRFTGSGEPARIPHPLDQPNVAHYPDAPTPHFWTV